MRTGRLPILLLLLVATLTFGQNDGTGRIIDGNRYEVPVLGLSIDLPRQWQVFETEEQQKFGLDTHQSATSQHCQGPLCKNPEIEQTIISRRDVSPVGVIFLLAYKIDVSQHKLRDLAEVMTKGSMKNSPWLPVGDLTAIQLDGRPAYRLIAQKPNSGYDAKALAYVSEANGYVFMLLGTTAPTPDSPTLLQSALEHLKLRQSNEGTKFRRTPEQH